MEVNIHEAKTHLSRLLQRVAAGEEVTIARSGVPVARWLQWNQKRNVLSASRAAKSASPTISMPPCPMTCSRHFTVARFRNSNRNPKTRGRKRKSRSSIRSAAISWKRARGNLFFSRDCLGDKYQGQARQAASCGAARAGYTSIHGEAGTSPATRYALACCQGLRSPLHHNNPFDRLIIAQAISEEMAGLTAESDFRKYPVKVLWCGR